MSDRLVIGIAIVVLTIAFVTGIVATVLTRLQERRAAAVHKRINRIGVKHDEP